MSTDSAVPSSSEHDGAVQGEQPIDRPLRVLTLNPGSSSLKLACQYALRRAAALLGTPAELLGLVVAHIGSGISVTAIDGGRSVDTSMGSLPPMAP